MEVAPQAKMPSPLILPLGIKKVLTNRSRTSIQDPGSETNSTQGLRQSTDSTREHSPKDLSRTSSRDDGSKPGSAVLRKLIPGHAKRKRRRMREAAGLFQTDSESAENNNSTINLSNAPAPIERNHSLSSLLQDDRSSLLTDDDSEPSSSRPTLLTHESHAGYLTHSSPLISTTTADDNTSIPQASENLTLSSQEFVQSPTLDASNIPAITHPPSLPTTDSTITPSSPNLPDRANNLALHSESRSSRRKSISGSIRGISPSRKLREAFQPGKSSRSPRTSPDRLLSRGNGREVPGAGVNPNEVPSYAQATGPVEFPLLASARTGTSDRSKPSKPGLPALQIRERPQTPPSAGLNTPLTTVTPPTPVDSHAPTPRSPSRPEPSTTSNEPGGIHISPSGNMISHRRVRSDSLSLHQPSKLSNAISAPLTPTIEEAKTPSVKSDSRTVTQGSGFFASWVSAAQNAANTITNTINTQTRSRSGTEESEPEKSLFPDIQSEPTVARAADFGASKRRLAVETLGAGDLKLSHLGIGTDSKENGTGPDQLGAPKESTIRRDEEAAKIEDMLAKRAVSAAYEKPSESNAKIPVAELSDPLNGLKHSATFNSNVSSELQTTPNGSILDGETGSVKRNNSVRSRLRDRRKRGSSTATGTSTVGTLLAASAASLANPTAGPKLSGFAIAPKARNRTFHQLFRSVPEDDFLIEDYSCALQKEILLAGRIYISEGHICFSSNILGWVTTLVISFEEVMSTERETTAMLFPNAIAVQTLHARHIFRSLLSREATFDLIIAIWKASHPAAFKKSINGKQAEEETAQHTDKPAETDSESDEGSEAEDEMYDEDEEEEGAGSFVEAGSLAGSDMTDGARSVTARKASAINGGAAASAMPAHPPAAGEGPVTEKAVAAASTATVDIPGPTTHAPTECTDSATHYDKILKDENIPAPLGKIYSMLFGPTSGVFLTKYLLEEQKVTELQYEDDKKGLGEQNKSRNYSYIKPLSGSIGPKQTKCITTENLDAFDLERSVSVTCTTQTPDVPSGSVFSVKTRYCLSWAPGNGTRLQMNCTIEWTGKSWLKGPIEKGATDGQATYGNDLVKALKSAVSSRPRAATAGSKGLKSGKRGRKSGRTAGVSPKSQATKLEDESWGLLEPFRGTFGPIVSIFKPFAGTLAVATIVTLLCIIWFRRPGRGSAAGLGYASYPSHVRLAAAYEEMWQKEESELWSWLEDRVGIERLTLRDDLTPKGKKASGLPAKAKAKQRQKALSSSRDVEARLREERMTEREMEDAIRVTQQRLDVLKGVMEKKRSGVKGSAPVEEDST